MQSRAVEIAASVYGAWRLARFDESGLSFLGSTPDSARRSFLVPLLLLPLWLLMLAVMREITIETLWFEGAVYVINWTLVPAVLTWLLPFLGRGDRVFAAVTAYNWAHLLIAPAMMVPVMLTALGITPAGLGATLFTLVLIWAVGFLGAVFRASLDIPPMMALPLTLLCLLLSYIVGYRI